MRMYVVQPPEGGDLAALCDAARDGRAAAMSRRRALAAGRAAWPPAPELPESDVRGPAAAVDPTPPARLARSISMQRRRQLAKGKRALNGGGGAPVLTVHRGGGG